MPRRRLLADLPPPVGQLCNLQIRLKIAEYELCLTERDASYKISLMALFSIGMCWLAASDAAKVITDSSNSKRSISASVLQPFSSFSSRYLLSRVLRFFQQHLLWCLRSLCRDIYTENTELTCRKALRRCRGRFRDTDNNQALRAPRSNDRDGILPITSQLTIKMILKSVILR